MSIRRKAAALIALFRKDSLESELENEVLAHLELAERDALASGLSPEAAKAAARKRFGGIDQMKEEHRDQRSARWIETFLRDLRYGLASLVRAPGFTTVVVGVLALGIGANVAMFSVVDAVLLKPIPFADPDRLVRVWEAPRPGSVNSSTPPEFLEWQRLGTSFAAMAAEQNIAAALSDTGEPIRLQGKAVTTDYFRVFAANAQLGRTFTPDDTQSVIVLSHAAWQNQFGADGAILQRKILLDGQPHQVVGVLAPGAFDRDETLFWKPLIFTPEQRTIKNHWLTVHGRLKDSLPVAREQMNAVHKALNVSAAADERESAIVIEPLAKLLVGTSLQQSVKVAFGAVLLVLLIACANVANLLLSKGATRRREMAVRAALGAGRSRLVVQLLTESILLCLLGALAGVAVAQGLLSLATPLLAESLPFTADVTLDWRVLSFAAAVAVAVALIAGILPALQTSYGNLADVLNRDTRGSSGTHASIRRAIVIGEVALSLVLVCGAVLLFRSLLNLQRIETGIRVENILTMSVDLPESAYPTPQKAALFYQSAAQRLRAVPGVVEAGLSTHIPLRWIMNGEAIQVNGVEKPVRSRCKRIDPGYLNSFGIPVLAGRAFNDRDVAGSTPVILINEAMAARLAAVAGIQDPIGKKVGFSTPGYITPNVGYQQVEIVGVIRNERVASAGAPTPPVSYLPFAQAPSSGVKLILRTRADLATVMPAIRQAMREIDPRLPLTDIATMEQVREKTLSGTSGPAKLIGAFAGIAVFLAAIGLYGVLSQVVVQQRREIGIRMALGARSSEVLTRILRNGLAMVAIGLVLGIGGAVALTRVMKSLLFEVSPLDPVSLTLACAAMITIGLIAGYVPASRAARVDPVHVLRDEG